MMKCKTCERFPVPTSRFDELGGNSEQHGTLYRCRDCGGYIEVIEGERAARFLTDHEASQSYGDLKKNR
jgi:hypothetical protein